MRTLTSEQHQSAHSALEEAGVLHGDLIEADVAVGSVAYAEGTHLAFCSAVVKPLRTLRHGSREERLLPIAGNVVFDNPSLVDGIVQGRQGIAVLRCTILTNGHVHITPTSVRFEELDGDMEACLRTVDGKELSAGALASV